MGYRLLVAERLLDFNFILLYHLFMILQIFISHYWQSSFPKSSQQVPWLIFARLRQTYSKMLLYHQTQLTWHLIWLIISSVPTSPPIFATDQKWAAVEGLWNWENPMLDRIVCHPKKRYSVSLETRNCRVFLTVLQNQSYGWRTESLAP